MLPRVGPKRAEKLTDRGFYSLDELHVAHEEDPSFLQDVFGQRLAENVAKQLHGRAEAQQMLQ